MPVETLVTWKEFESLPEKDNVRYEYDEGRVIELSPTKGRHERTRRKLVKLWQALIPADRGEIAEEMSIRLAPGVLRIPDVAIIRVGGDQEDDEDGYVKVVPFVIAEILSPSDTIEEVERKIQQYLDCGVRQVLLLNPKPQIHSVTDYRGSQIRRHTSGRVLVDLPQYPFELSVEDLWVTTKSL